MQAYADVTSRHVWVEVEFIDYEANRDLDAYVRGETPEYKEQS